MTAGASGGSASGGSMTRSQATADASRARDPQFDSAIFGNSTGQLLKPAELSQATGAHFVQLVAPGAYPRGQLAILDFFIRHHRRVGALVIVVADLWCTRDSPGGRAIHFRSGSTAGARSTMPAICFPGARSITPFKGSRSVLAARAHDPRRLLELRGGFPPGKSNRRRAAASTAAVHRQGQRSFPVEALLGDAIKKLPADVPVVLLMPPTFYTIVPHPAASRRPNMKPARRLSGARGRPAAQQFHRLSHRQCLDPRSREFCRSHPLSRDDRAKNPRGHRRQHSARNAAKIDF